MTNIESGKKLCVFHQNGFAMTIEESRNGFNIVFGTIDRDGKTDPALIHIIPKNANTIEIEAKNDNR